MLIAKGTISSERVRSFILPTSGGLLVILAKEKADRFCEEFAELEGCPAWIVGEVVQSSERSATLVAEPKLIEVAHTSIQPPKRIA